LLELTAIGVILVPIGLGIFVAAERFAMRTGRLKRNG
jgi:ABC-2 type transport system permease protein